MLVVARFLRARYLASYLTMTAKEVYGSSQMSLDNERQSEQVRNSDLRIIAQLDDRPTSVPDRGAAPCELCCCQPPIAYA